jgi:putative sterol carrier protein
MAAKFPSQAWADAMIVEVNNSEAYARAAKEWEGDFYFVVQETGEIVYMDLWHGACREATFITDPGCKDPVYKITAKLDNWKKVLAGKLDPVQGMITRQLKLDGNLVQIMKNVKAAQELVRCAARVDTVF